MGKRKRLYPENLLMELSLSLETGMDIDYENLTDDQLIGLEYVLSLLTERSQALIHEYYKNNKSRKQIAEQYHLTENRVRQCIGHALRDLSKNKEMFFYIAKGYQANVQYLTEQLNNEELFYKKQRGICSNDEHIFYQEIGAFCWFAFVQGLELEILVIFQEHRYVKDWRQKIYCHQIINLKFCLLLCHGST